MFISRPFWGFVCFLAKLAESRVLSEMSRFLDEVVARTYMRNMTSRREDTTVQIAVNTIEHVLAACVETSGFF